jgi:hypothetical protein
MQEHTFKQDHLIYSNIFSKYCPTERLDSSACVENVLSTGLRLNSNENN